MSKYSHFRFIDLFAGIGGFRKALEAIGGQCVFTCERDKFSLTTYRANFTINHPIGGDIKDYTSDTTALNLIPAHDLLAAGFPCQPFSIAGVSKNNSLGRPHGFQCPTQGTLFYDIVQIVRFHRPAVILLENVKNLLSHDGGNTFQVIRHTLQEQLGYSIHYRVINGRFWVPQNRERIFIVGFRQRNSFDFDALRQPDAAKGPRLSAVLHKTDGSEPDEPPYLDQGKVPDKYTLTPGLWEYLQAYKKKHQAAGNGFGFGLVGLDDITRTLSARYYKDGSEILIRQRGKRPRRLTPRECSRLMGFDKPGASEFRIPVSDTQAYRQFGNSIIVPVVEAIAHLIKPFFRRA